MSKLVRDKNEHLFRGRKLHATFTKAPTNQRKPLLTAKLLEEVGEFIAATDQENALQELGDILTVVWALAENEGFSPKDVLVESASKDKGRGVFDQLYIMELEDCKSEPVQPSPHYTYDTWQGSGYSG